MPRHAVRCISPSETFMSRQSKRGRPRPRPRPRTNNAGNLTNLRSSREIWIYPPRGTAPHQHRHQAPPLPSPPAGPHAAALNGCGLGDAVGSGKWYGGRAPGDGPSWAGLGCWIGGLDWRVRYGREGKGTYGVGKAMSRVRCVEVTPDAVRDRPERGELGGCRWSWSRYGTALPSRVLRCHPLLRAGPVARVCAGRFWRSGRCEGAARSVIRTQEGDGALARRIATAG